MSAVQIARVEVFVFRVPIETPVETSFGVMIDRPAVFVRLWDRDGAFGWGEVFANWPAAGAEHRAQLLIRDIADLVIGFCADTPSALFEYLGVATHIRALQCGEWGPFRQVIAGLDTALYDLFARRANVPLARFLTPDAAGFVPAYASGLHIGRADETLPACRARGYTAFKVKIGFAFKADIRQLENIVGGLKAEERLFTDANQAWTLDQAITFLRETRELDLGWIEEPLRADRPLAQWAMLAGQGGAPLAAGENIAGNAAFAAVIASGAVAFIQPDVAKWGGITGCYHVANAALRAGRTYCPHFLGGGIGLIASAHLLAAIGGPGMLEVDANPNPLRDDFLAGQPTRGGRFEITDAPGLGVTTLPETLLRFQTLTLSRG